MKSTESIKQGLRPKKDERAPRKFLNTGSTLLNLACSGRPFGGFMEGGFYLVVGDSSAGKTVLAGTCLAEAAISEKFKDHDLYFDNVEDGAMMFDKFFGPRIAARIKSPGEGDTNSDTVQSFYYNHSKACSRGSNVYVLDSENALSSDEEIKKLGKIRKAMEDDTEAAGVMTDGKAKLHSQNLRGACADARDTNSILIMLCQSREAMGFGAQFEPKTRAGGKALKFYCHVEMWFSIVKRLTKEVKGRTREIGIIAQVKIKKNRFTGKCRTVEIPIYHSFGIDDIGSCISYLLQEKHWSKSSGVIKAPEFNFEGKRDALIEHIEQNNLERDLRKLVGEVWDEIESACEVKRKSRYE